MDIIPLVVQWFLSSVEYRQFGLNLATIGAFGTFFFTFLQGWSTLEQNRQIWKNKSGEGIESLMFGYSASYFLSFCYFGMYTGSVAAVFNGLLGFLYLPILFGICRFESVRLLYIATISLLGIAMIVLMMVVSDKDSLLMLYLFGILFFLAKQAWKVWKNNDMGELNLQYVLVFFVTCIFWTLYAFAIHSWPLEVFNILAVIIFSFMLKPWLKERFLS